MTDRPSARMKQRLNIWLSLPVAAILIYTVATIFSVSIKDGKKWQSLANAQQLKSTAVSASRGTIYDSNGTVLSQSATVYTVYADPLMLKEKLDDNDKKIEELKGYIAKEDDASKKATYQQRLDATKSGDECLDELVEFLALNLEIDTNTVREKLTKTDTQYIVLKKEVEKTVSTAIEDKLTELGIDGRIITAKASDGTEIPYRYKQSYDAQDGDDLNLNIDANIQYILEKELAKAVEENQPTDRACGIIMNPKTGQIYAMATSDPYDPNEPAAISDEKTAAELAGLDEDSNDYKQKQLDAWSLQWKNKAVSEIYNPGSVFKVITGASALEEKAITLNDTFGCGTQIQVEDTTFHCWSTTDHGSQDFAQAMLNSCNPVFIQIGMKLGSEKFCQYYNAFGFNELTGIDLPAESNSISMPLSNMGPVQLASSSFGQTNKVTPIQMITAYSAAINGGYLVTPQVVNSITDENGNIVKKMDTVVRRQVISEDTSASMREILEGVVEGQPGSNCYIKGYRIGGKSGTSQKIDEDSTGQTYVSSYCAFAPADDPEIVMLVMVDHPTGEKFYGSQVAAPICVNVLSDVLPYVGIFPEYDESELADLQVSVPSVQYYTVEEAKKTLEDLGLEVKVKGEGDTVVKQTPVAAKIEHGGSVVLYTEANAKEETVTVPELKGLTKEQARATLDMYGLNLTAEGSGYEEEGAVAQSDQSVGAGQSVPMGTAVSVTFAVTSVGSQ